MNTLTSPNASPQKTIQVVFRFDDYSTSSNTALEQRILMEFSNLGAPITFAVIPFEAEGYVNGQVANLTPLSDDKGLILKQAAQNGIVEVALHGHIHCSVREGDPAEFIGLGLPNQQARLEAGKALLEQITQATVTTFVPPWNQFDDDTLHALRASGFKMLSARADAPANTNTNLDFLPATTGIRGATQAIEAARRQPGNHIVVILFHEYDFIEFDKQRGCMNLEEFTQLMVWIKQQSDIEVLSMQQAAQQSSDLSLTRYHANRRSGILARLLPAGWVKPYDGFYHDGGHVYQQLKLKTGIFYGTIMLLAAILSYVLASALLPISALFVQLGAAATVIVATGVIYRAFRYCDPFMRGVSLSALSVGASLGCIGSVLSL